MGGASDAFSNAIGGSNLTDIVDPGDIFGSKAKEQAGQISSQAAADILKIQKDLFDQIRIGEAPVRDARDQALGILTALDEGTGQLATDPNLAFQQEQQQRAIRNASAAGGKLDSGGRLIGEQEARAGLASQDIQGQLSKILNLAGFTTSGNVNANALLGSTAQGVAQGFEDVGTANAAELLNKSNTQNRLLNSAFSTAGSFQGSAN